jgi:hypothetical protein
MFDLIGYSDAHWALCKIDRKSTSGTCQFLGRSLVSWASKKQNSVALSTVEAEYIAAGHCCAQLLWIRQTLRDYGYKLTKVPLLCDNESAIRMADNPIEHSRTKHIAIQYHFLRDHQQRGCRRFGPGGVPGPTSKFVAMCPCPDGLARDGTQGRNAARIISHRGCVLVVGVTSVRERERVSLFVSSFPARPSRMKALDLPFIDARIGPGVQWGV